MSQYVYELGATPGTMLRDLMAKEAAARALAARAPTRIAPRPPAPPTIFTTLMRQVAAKPPAVQSPQLKLAIARNAMLALQAKNQALVPAPAFQELPTPTFPTVVSPMVAPVTPSIAPSALELTAMQPDTMPAPVVSPSSPYSALPYSGDYESAFSSDLEVDNPEGIAPPAEDLPQTADEFSSLIDISQERQPSDQSLENPDVLQALGQSPMFSDALSIMKLASKNRGSIVVNGASGFAAMFPGEMPNPMPGVPGFYSSPQAPIYFTEPGLGQASESELTQAQASVRGTPPAMPKSDWIPVVLLAGLVAVAMVRPGAGGPRGRTGWGR